MKRSFMILLAAVLLLGTVPFGMGQTFAEASTGKLKEGLYPQDIVEDAVVLHEVLLADTPCSGE